MPDIDYTLKLKCATLRADVMVNDCLAFRHAAPWPREAELKLTPWIVLGQNRIEVRVGEMSEAELAQIPSGGDQPSAPELVLGGHIVARAVGECLSTNEVLGYRWTEGESPPPGPSRATVFRHRWLVDETFGPWAWETAIPFAPKDRDDVIAAVAQLRTLLVRRDFATLEALLAVKTEELCRAYGLPHEATRREHMELFATAAEADDFELDTWRPESLQLELDARGRLVRVTTQEDRPALLGRANGRPFAYDLAFSNVDGAWLVVR
jgi:hypothetical protein